MKTISIEKYIPKKYRHTIESFYKDIDGVWLDLKEGYISTTTESTSIHEDTINQVRKELKTIISEKDYNDCWENKRFVRKKSTYI